MRTIRVGTAFLSLALASLGCGSSRSGTTHVGIGRIPTSATDVMIRVDTRGGFTSAEYQFGIVPELTVYGDGQVIVSGPVTEQYPPQALPNLRAGRIDRSTIVALIDRARADGLFRTVDFGKPQITDYPTTMVTVNDGKEHAQRVYALGVESEPHDVDDPTSPSALKAALGLTEAQARARRRLQDFVTAVENSATRAATEPYTASEVAIFVRPATPVATNDPVEPGTASWPLGTLATIGTPVDQGPGADTSYRCTVLRDADAERVLEAAADASSITRWRSADHEYSIVFRPLLPDEHACPGLGTRPRL